MYLMQADLLFGLTLLAELAGRSWTLLDEWKMALVMVLVEVERVKMVVVC